MTAYGLEVRGSIPSKGKDLLLHRAETSSRGPPVSSNGCHEIFHRWKSCHNNYFKKYGGDVYNLWNVIFMLLYVSTTWSSGTEANLPKLL